MEKLISKKFIKIILKRLDSKILQYHTLPALFPHTVCFDKQFLLQIKNDPLDRAIEKIIDKINILQFPMIFKTDEGCRGDGVYLVGSKQDLRNLLQKFMFELQSNSQSKFRNGFLLQEWVKTHANLDISNYFRINIINGKAQSSVQFQLKWEKSDVNNYKKLADFKNAEDKPIDLAVFDSLQLKRVVSACPCQDGVIGADVLYDNENKMHLLEYNDGPAVSAIVDLAQRNNPEINNSAIQQCFNFPDEIAKLCFLLIERGLTQQKTQTNSAINHQNFSNRFWGKPNEKLMSRPTNITHPSTKILSKI